MSQAISDNEPQIPVNACKTVSFKVEPVAFVVSMVTFPEVGTWTVNQASIVVLASAQTGKDNTPEAVIPIKFLISVNSLYLPTIKFIGFTHSVFGSASIAWIPKESISENFSCLVYFKT